MPRPNRIATVLAGLLGAGSLVLAAGWFAATAAARPGVKVKAGRYRVKTGRHRATARFTLTYRGSGSFHTRYHSEPPNPGGAHDTNDAYDSSAVRWAITFRAPLVVPACGRPRRAAADRCARISSPYGATGTLTASGKVSHVHRDGLFPSQNASIACRVHAATARHWVDRTTVRVHYSARAGTLSLTALDPVADVINILPGQCPGQGDPLDGLYDNYFTPGFSFAPGYGPDRWLRSRTVVIPVRVLHRARTITIRLTQTRAGTPPPNCAVQFPAYERCSTGGSWAGTLRLTARK